MNDKFLSMISISKKAGKCFGGAFLSDQYIKSGKAKLVILSKDAGKNNRNDIINACKYRKVQMLETEYTKEQLGHSLGKDKCVSIVITDENFKKALLNIINVKAINQETEAITNGD